MGENWVVRQGTNRVVRRGTIGLFPGSATFPQCFIGYLPCGGKLGCSAGNNIHLFPLHKGDMTICSLEKSHISRGKYDYFEGEQIFISPLCKGNECFIPPGQRFGEFCQMKYFGNLCLQNYYFGTSL